MGESDNEVVEVVCLREIEALKRLLKKEGEEEETYVIRFKGAFKSKEEYMIVTEYA